MMFFYRKALCNLILILAGIFTLGTPAYSQGLPSLGAKKSESAQEPAAVDPLKRNTPRSAIYGLLESCHSERYNIAAQYLDLSRIRRDLRAAQGPDLAEGLCDALNRDTRFEVGRLSNEPAGDLTDSFGRNLDGLDTFDVNGRPVEITLQRSTLGDVQAWLVSPESVLQIPKLVALNTESPLEKRLPAVLVNTKFIATPLYIWLALIAAAVIIILLSPLLSRALLFVLRPLARRIGKNLHEHRLESFAGPLRLLLSVIIFSVVIQAVGPSAILRDYLFKLLVLLFLIACASIFMRIVDVISDTISLRLDPRERALSYSVLPLIVRAVKVIIFAIALLSVLSAWGYNTNTILAGLGVGGLAVALAAQKTIENLFGGVAVITDRPVLVGDFCKFGDQVGTIEDIGLRSTRIRTLDRTVVTIPNSVFSTMTLENFAKRDRMWFHPPIALRRDTPAEKIKAIMEAISKILEDHPMVDPTSVPLRFTKIDKESFNLEVFAYVLTPSFDEFLRVQSDLLLKIVAAARQLEVDFAVPLQETMLARQRSKN